MKRTSSASPSSPPSKKQKKSPRVSETEIVVPAGEQNDQVLDTSWQRVEKRKRKKAEKKDAKLDVCVSIVRPTLTILTSYRRILPDFCILMPRSSNVEMQSASMYHLFSPFIYSTYLGQQDVRDLVLHIIADAPPPSWIRVQVSFPSACLHFLHAPLFVEPAHHSKASRPPRSGSYVHSTFPPPPPYLLHRESQRSYPYTRPTRSSTANPTLTCRTS